MTGKMSFAAIRFEHLDVTVPTVLVNCREAGSIFLPA